MAEQFRWMCALMTFLFVIAKLIGVITWSWWVVLMPLWLPFVFGLALIFGLAFAAAWRNTTPPHKSRQDREGAGKNLSGSGR